MITMDKKYKTRDGQPARILCTDAPGNAPVRALIGEVVLGHTAQGVSVYRTVDDAYTLIEVGPYDDFKIDEPVMVRHGEELGWTKRHFAGVGSGGQPQGWSLGGTSWFSKDDSIVVWAECRRPTAEELAA